MDLEVRIPEIYKEDFYSRFDKIELEKGHYIIHKTWKLCHDFYKNSACICGVCPFNKFREEENMIWGCVIWMKKIVGDPLFYMSPNLLMWGKDVNDIVRKQLECFQKEAKELITWVE